MAQDNSSSVVAIIAIVIIVIFCGAVLFFFFGGKPANTGATGTGTVNVLPAQSDTNTSS